MNIKIETVEKSIDYVVANFRTEALCFVKINPGSSLDKFNADTFRGIYGTPVKDIAIKNLERQLDDPHIALVKIYVCDNTEGENISGGTGV